MTNFFQSSSCNAILFLYCIISRFNSIHSLIGSHPNARIKIQQTHSTSLQANVGQIKQSELLSASAAVSKNLFSRGGHLSFSDAVGSPIALALHSGRFSLIQQSMKNIPGKANLSCTENNSI